MSRPTKTVVRLRSKLEVISTEYHGRLPRGAVCRRSVATDRRLRDQLRHRIFESKLLRDPERPRLRGAAPSHSRADGPFDRLHFRRGGFTLRDDRSYRDQQRVPRAPRGVPRRRRQSFVSGDRPDSGFGRRLVFEYEPSENILQTRLQTRVDGYLRAVDAGQDLYIVCDSWRWVPGPLGRRSQLRR